MSKKIIIPIIAVFVLAPALYVYYNYALSLPNSSKEAKVGFVVESGQSVEEIAKNLYEQGLVRSAALFQLYTSVSKISQGLQAGEYQIPQNLNVEELAELLRHGTFEEKLTFIEGWRREEMAEAISSKSQIPNSKLNAAEFLRETEGLEGYLFPDTYFVSTETTAKDLVGLMRENFENRIERNKVELKGITFEEAVIIASIVAREVQNPQDKAIVAEILIKRYQNDWPLQADATIQYALGYQGGASALGGSDGDRSEAGWWKKNLTLKDLEVASPYNTYKNPGLPPTPICNPGLDSLEATFNPTETEYWYYISDDQGNTHFAKTIEEHNQNVAKYLR